ncbi:MAG: alanine--glyoxylate aminotransferase family protein [Anaerolineae bacterium]|nr:alanine--glyoxylate aminotransferase family protein [Anaerolineae bacterium]
MSSSSRSSVVRQQPTAVRLLPSAFRLLLTDYRLLTTLILLKEVLVSEVNLRIPGPTPLPPSVQEAMRRDMINHRGPEFAQMQAEIVEALKVFLQTQNDVLLLTASGTGGLEAAVVNTLSPGDKVLSVSIGYFGERFRTIAQVYGADIVKLDIPQGQAARGAQVAEALRAAPDVKAVLVTHNETSTGVTNPLQEIAAEVKAAGKLLLVDAISSAGCVPLETDAWGVDVLVTGSQKGWMAPPGLAFLSMSREAWAAHATAKMPHFYFDLKRHKKAMTEGSTPWTPAVSVYYALHEGMRLLMAEGREKVLARHQRVADLTREGLKAMGLRLFADPQFASNTVTSVYPPAGLNADDFRRQVKKAHNVVLAGAQGDLAGKVFRVGHLGYVHEADIAATLDAIRAELPLAVPA